jgi:hypothetical protein
MEREKLIMPNINLSDSEQKHFKSNAYADLNLTAPRFLQALDHDSDLFCFQVFDDLKTRRDPRLAATLHGSLAKVGERLARFNQQGAGVFVAVNAIRPGCERKIENLERVRAIWQDDDAGWNGPFPIAPSIVVRTSPGKFQRYWIADRLKPDLHQAIMRRLATNFGADPGTRDLVRVLRLPGFFHVKDPATPHRVELIEATGQVYTADEIRAAFPPIWPDPPAAKPKPFNKRAFDADAFGRLLEALSHISADNREVWYRVGAALRFEVGDAARDLWDGWSATSSKFNPKDQEKAWRSFQRRTGRTVTLGTVYHWARSNGFRETRHA